MSYLRSRVFLVRTDAGGAVLDSPVLVWPEPPDVPTPAADGADDEGGLLAGVRALAGGGLLAAWPDQRLSARLAEVFAAEQVLAAQRLALIAEVDGRGQPRREGATSTTTWLRDTLRVAAGT